jgi:hypothetical protein
MNERIRELAKKVGVSFGGHPMNALAIYDSELQKFAELLLEDFIEALDKYNSHHSEMSDYGLSILIGNIRIHFGMEEKNDEQG